MRVLVIIPTYDEALNIDEVIDRVNAAVPIAHVLVVDDGSPDGTGDIVATRATDDERVHLLRRPGKNGLGTAYRDGFAWGAAEGFDVFVQMDADLQHDPAALPSILAAIEAGADVVIGSRYVRGGSIPDWGLYRRSLSRWGNRYAQMMLGVPVADSTAGFRAYRAEALKGIDLDAVRADGYGFQIEMTYRTSKQGRTIREVPISFGERHRGESKMSGRIVAEALVLVTAWGVKRALRR